MCLQIHLYHLNQEFHLKNQSQSFKLIIQFDNKYTSDIDSNEIFFNHVDSKPAPQGWQRYTGSFPFPASFAKDKLDKLKGRKGPGFRVYLLSPIYS